MSSIGLNLSYTGLDGHRYVQSTGKPVKGTISLVCEILINQYLPKQMGLNKWRKETRTWTFNHQDHTGTTVISDPINYNIISSYIREHGRFDESHFKMPHLECMWLDHATEMKMGFHMHDETGSLTIESGDLQTHYYGEKYPIRPKLSKEGHLYTSFQPLLLGRIMRDRKSLIEGSRQALADDWVFDFRNLVSNSISLLEIALTQFYIKAEYDPLPGWTFNKEKLGERHGRRLNDKFKWIFQITGKHLGIEAELQSIDSLRTLRNHLMHFDPPSLVITFEEVVVWLNQIIDIGKIIIKMRTAMGVIINVELLNFVLQEQAVFVAAKPWDRSPLVKGIATDYQSSVWPNTEGLNK